MAESYADVTVHIDEALDGDRLRAVADALRRQMGVSAVESHESRPHLMVVKYDPLRINSQSIHRTITDQGYHAELLGL